MVGKVKKFRKILGFGVVLVLVTALAAPVLADSYRFYAPIVVTETSGSSRSGIPILVDLNNQGLVGWGHLSSTGLDTRLQEAGTDRDYSVIDSRFGFVVPSLSAYQGKEFDYYTSYSPDNDAFGVVVGDGGYGTISDTGNLELGSNFIIEQKGWIDTTAGSRKYLIDKFQAYRTYISGANTITSAILGSGNTSPTGDGGGAWNNKVNAYDDDPGEANWADSGAIATGNYSPWLELTHAAISCTGVRVYLDDMAVADADTETEIDIFYDSAWYNIFTGDDPATTWTEHLLSFTETVTSMRVRFYNNSGGILTFRVHEVDFIEETEDVVVSATSVSSGEHTVRTTADGTNLKIYIDGTEEDSAALGGSSVPDEDSNWRLVWNSVMSYMDYYRHTVGGILVAYYHPITIITGTTLPDRRADSGTADSGTAVTLRDAILTEGDDYWNGITLEIMTTTDGLAPQGEIAIITDFIAANDELQFAALTAVVDTGDTYELRNDGTIAWGGRFADSGSVVTLTDSELTQVDDYWNGYTLKIKEVSGDAAPEGEEVEITDFTLATLGGTADSGTNVTLVDAVLVQPTAYWAGATLTIVTTTDGGAPQGESKVVTTWDLPTNTLTFPAMTAVVDTGDTYTLTAANTLFFGALTAAVGAGNRYEIWDGQTILWASFPEGISVEVGALVAYTNPVSSATGLDTPEAVGVPQEPSGLQGGSASESLPLYPLFYTAATGLGWTTDVLYVFAWIIIAVGLGLALLITTGSTLAAIGGVGVGMVGGMSTGMLPVWVLIVYLILGGSWLYVSRSM